MQNGREIVVAGAGAFGVTAALELSRRGWAVTVVDRSLGPHPDASSTDVSKMVRMDYGADRFYHELAEASLEGWERWNVEWSEPLYHDDGFLVLSARPMRPGGYEHESHRILVERGYEPERLTRQILEERHPMWSASEYPDGYLSPRGGWAESGSVVKQLVRLAREEGVRFVEGTFLGPTTDGSGASGARVGVGGERRTPRTVATSTDTEESIPADHVLVCAGAWTPRLLPATATLLRSVAQPVLHFGVDEPEDYRPPAFPPFAADISGSGWYGFPALADGRVKLGHHGPGRAAPPDDRGVVGEDHVQRARTFLARSIPSLARAPIVETRVCMYCDTPDGDLLVDRLPGMDGVTVAAGGSGHAFKFAPMLGAIIGDAVEGVPNRWLERFRWRTPSSEAAEDARFTETKGSRA